jgi:hypothetical protein
MRGWMGRRIVCRSVYRVVTNRIESNRIEQRLIYQNTQTEKNKEL